MSIEILPPGWISSVDNPYSPFEFAEKNLGVPKKVYYQIYGEAIRRFNDYLSTGIIGLEQAQITDLIEVSCIVLLINPAHATCLNRRRILIEEGILQEADELKTTASLQLLKEGAKSSILWHHRRWLLQRIYKPHSSTKEDIPLNVDTLDECILTPEAFAQEISLVTTANEIYPRNYHAWFHRYKCLQSLATAYSSTASSSSKRESLAQVLRAEEFVVSKWIELNVSDYTAAQYLCHIYSAMEERGIDHIQMHSEGEPESNANLQPQKSPFSPINHALELIRRYPAHESLWYYLRTAYSAQPKDTEDLHHIQEMQSTYADNFRRWKRGFECR